MISVEEAVSLIKTHLPTWGTHRLSREEIRADRDYPPFHRVMMDGIAVSFAGYARGERKFQVLGVLPAGEPAAVLNDTDVCFEVMTGAPLPLGADLVIPYEHLKIVDGVAEITREEEREPFENVHLAGSDCSKDDLVLEKGVRPNGPHWGIAASMGKVSALELNQPKIMIISTGNELVDIDEVPADHQIRRSNAYALRASLQLHGFSDVTLAHLKDDPAACTEHYRQHASKFDMLIYSGGVSKGKFDYLPSVWTELGVTRYFHGVTQRPGKPLWFGRDEKLKTVVVGLPGNPVSSLVALHRYFLPQREMYARLDKEITFKNKLTYFVPVKIRFEKDGTLHATPLEMQNSGEFTALAGSDGFLELPRDQEVFSSGECFRYFSWGRG